MNFPNGKLTITITYVNFSPQQLIYKRKRKPQAEWSITWLYTFTPKPDKAPKSTFQRGAGLRTDSLLWEVEMEWKCLLLMLLRECWSVFWVACNICGWMLVCGMSIRMTASHPGQEEELLFFCWTLFRQTHSRHEGGWVACSYDETSRGRRSCLTSGRYHLLNAVINTRQWF